MSETSAKKISTNTGKLTLNQAGDALVLWDGSIYRMIIGVTPDGIIDVVISKEGEDVYDDYT